MHGSKCQAAVWGMVFGVGVLVAVQGRTEGHPNYVTAFSTKYPSSTLLARTQSRTGNSCYLCHHPTSTSNPGNCYRTALSARIQAGRTIAQALADVEGMDSDGDGVPNGVEILMARTDLPGQVGYNPGLIGATGTDPCATSTTTPVTSQRETPPAPCPADADGNGQIQPADVGVFINIWVTSLSQGTLAGDFDHNNAVESADVAAFVAAWFAALTTGC